MAGARCLLRTPGNFQSSAMFEASESSDAEGVTTDSSLTPVTTCKKVLCSNSVLDSSEYWLRSDKALCQIGFLDDTLRDGGCTTICFVNLDRHSSNCHDDSCIKELACVSPDLPKLIGSLAVRQPKENEILLLSGLHTPDSCQPEHTHTQRAADVCLVQCDSGRRPAQPSNIIFEINKFLIGLQAGQDRQRPGRLARQRVADDDTNRSVSSIEEDFLTASEHLADDSEDDPYRNDLESGDVGDSGSEVPRGSRVPACPRGRGAIERDNSEDSESTLCASASQILAGPRRGPTGAPQRAAGRRAKESTGHYATNLAESVLQDAFIRLSQDEVSFAPEAAVSVSSSPTSRRNVAPAHSTPPRQPNDKHPRARTLSFELPKIVIVQSPEGEEAAEWPGAHASSPSSHGVLEHDDNVPAGAEEDEEEGAGSGHRGHRGPVKPVKPVEVEMELALACAASVIGTITTPQLTLESGEEEDEDTEEEEEEDGADNSFSSAMCGMAQVAGVIAVVDLAEEVRGIAEGDGDPSDLCSPSPVPLLCGSVAERGSLDAFRTSVAEALLREASAVLTAGEERGRHDDDESVANFLERTHGKIVAGIAAATSPQTPGGLDRWEADEFARDVADGVFRRALEKAAKRRELEAPGKEEAADVRRFLRESVDSLLFDVLCATSKRIGDISSQGSSWDRYGEYEVGDGGRAWSQSQSFAGRGGQPDNGESQSGTDNLLAGRREERWTTSMEEAREREARGGETQQHRHGHGRSSTSDLRERSADSKLPSAESSPCRDWVSHEGKGRQRSSSLTPQNSLTSPVSRTDSGEPRSLSPVTCFADNLAATVVSMATELAAICLENSSGKQPWFCALKAEGSEVNSGLLLPCRSVLRRKEVQNGGGTSSSSAVAAKKHRPPRLSEIKRKTEEQPELMERLVNRVVDDNVNLDEPGYPRTPPTSADPFALFASEVTARIMNCPELSVVDTSPSKPSRSRLQCERWSSRGKAGSYESIPEEDNPTGTPNTLGAPGGGGSGGGGAVRLGQNLSRGSSVSKQSSCESITDEFSRFMVNQMETEGREFDLLLDYYAGKNAGSILAAAVQQAAVGGRRNGHLGVRRASCCLSKQSSTESITEEFYRFMLRDADKENREFGVGVGATAVAKATREWSNSLLPPLSPARSPFCVRQSSVPDRRSSDSRLTVHSPVKANSFDGFARNVRGAGCSAGFGFSGIGGGGGGGGGYPGSLMSACRGNVVSATGLCKSDSCLYRGSGQTDHITDMLIHETWSSSIEALMRKNKIIADPSEEEEENGGDGGEGSEGGGGSADLDLPPLAIGNDAPQPHVQLFANRLAADIVESGKSVAGGHQEAPGGAGGGAGRRQPLPVGERRRGFKHSRPASGRVSRPSLEPEGAGEGDGGVCPRALPRDVPLIHIEPERRDEVSEDERAGGRSQDSPQQNVAPRGRERAPASRGSRDRDKGGAATAPPRGGRGARRSLSASSEESWAQVAPDDDPQEETSSFIHLSEGNGNSSASSLGLADLEGFPDIPSQSVTSEESEKKDALKETQGSADEVASGLSVGGSSSNREMLVLNFDLEAECVDAELRTVLQWIAASELGVPTLYFRKSQDESLTKFHSVVQLVQQRAWRVGELFGAVVEFCQLQDDRPHTSLFDWLLDTHH